MREFSRAETDFGCCVEYVADNNSLVGVGFDDDVEVAIDVDVDVDAASSS